MAYVNRALYCTYVQYSACMGWVQSSLPWSERVFTLRALVERYSHTFGLTNSKVDVKLHLREREREG